VVKQGFQTISERNRGLTPRRLFHIWKQRPKRGAARKSKARDEFSGKEKHFSIRGKEKTSRAEERIGRAEEKISRAEEKIGWAEERIGQKNLSPCKAEDFSGKAKQKISIFRANDGKRIA